MLTVDVTTTPTGQSVALADAARRLAGAGALGDTVLATTAGGLPEALAAELRRSVRAPRPSAGFRVVRGLLSGFADPGPTPGHWSDADRQRTGAFDVALVMVAELLGRVFGWVDQQDGRIVHNIVPTPGCEQQQIGASSTATLAWHTEDAFHPHRADLLVLACVRNPNDIGSSLSSIGRADLDAGDVEQLERPCVVIRPDDSYGDAGAARLADIGMATLWRGPESLAIRYDPSYSAFMTDDPGFVEAYHRLGSALEARSTVVPLEPGDVLIIDNNAAVHGREPFEPRYDGTDRWLKRVLVRAPVPRPARERFEHGYDQQQVDPRRAA